MREQTVGSILANRANHLGEDAYMFYGPEDRTVSFGETDATANAVGNALRNRGVQEQDNVSVMLRDPVQTMFAMFGINRAGAVYSPLNYDYEGSILAYQLNDTDPGLLVIEDQYVNRLNEIADDLTHLPAVAVYETDANSDPLDSRFERYQYNAFLESPQNHPGVTASWHDAASIVYTSGTTGKPKGVVIPHRWIFGNYIYPSQPSEEGVVHCPLPLYHVGGLYAAAVSALASGGSVALWDQFRPTKFWGRIEAYGVTSVVLISVMMDWLMDQPERADDRDNTVQYASMNPLPDNYDAIARRFGFDFVTASFGQTESGNPTRALIHAAQGEYGTPEAIRRMAPTEIIERAETAGTPVVDETPGDRFIGRPTDYVEVSVVDENDEELPPGEVGEMIIRPSYPGVLMTEYYGKPEATVDAWRNLWFHTGDAVYRDEAGHFFFVDRMGDVIRRRGENISSMQVQDAATTHQAVAGAAAFPVPAEQGGEDEVGLAAAPTAGETVTEGQLREHMTATLPDFMIPKHIWIIDEIPTTETNKREKYKLRERLLGEHQ